MDFDAVLEKCGNYGRFQFTLLLLFGYTNILSSLHFFAQTIISFTPEHRCFHEKLSNLSFHEIKQVYANIERPSCTLLEDIIDGKGVVSTANAKCDRWIYNYERGYESASTELKWVCDDDVDLAIGQSIFYIGSVVGAFIFGIMADRVGRLPSLVVSTLCAGVGDFMTSYANSLVLFSAGRFISGLSTDTLFYLMYIVVFEYLNPKKRTFGLNIITALFYCFGTMLSPWAALWVGSWRYYLLISSLPTLTVLLYPIFVCESAQWLITKQRVQDAVRCLKHVARFNRRQVEDSVFEQFVAHYERKFAEEQKLNGPKDTFWGMLRTPRLRRITIIMLAKSMIITLTFDIISRNMEGLGSSPFALLSYTSVIYIPAGLTIIFLQNVIGRKGMACGSLFVGGIITAITGFLIAIIDHEENFLLLGLMVGLGRYGANVAFNAGAQYAAELIPTSVRAQGMANVHVVGYATSFLTAYIIYLGNYYKPLPSIVNSVLMLIGAALCLALPETLNQKLPQTLSEGEVFGKDEKWYYFPCIGQQKPESKKDVTEIS